MKENNFKVLINTSKIKKNNIRLSNEKKKRNISSSNNNNHHLNTNNYINKNTNFDLSHQNVNRNSEKNTLQFSNRSTKEIRKVHHYKKKTELIPNRENIKGRYNINCSNIKGELKTDCSLRKNRNLNLTNNSKYKNNSNDDFIDSDFSNDDDNINIQILEYKQVIKVLSYYISFIQKEFEKKIRKINEDKIKVIHKLKKENEFLIKENKELKLNHLNLIYLIKQYEEKEIKKRNKECKILNEIFNENIYLRKAIYNTSDINISTLLKMKKDIEFNKGIFSNKILKEEINNEENKEEENNPFNLLKQENTNPKGNHRRQRTHFNLGDIEKYNLSEKEKDSSISSTSTIVASEKDDILEETLRDILNYNKTLKRNNNSKKNITDKDNGKEEKKDVINTLNLSNKKQPQLYYRTPKEKIKIEFTK